jgi:hypothetical protein
MGLLLLLADIIVIFTNQRRRALYDYLGKSVFVDLGVFELVHLTKIPLDLKDNPWI